MLASDHAFTPELDLFAADLAAADRAVAELRAQRTAASDPAREAQR